MWQYAPTFLSPTGIKHTAASTSMGDKVSLAAFPWACLGAAFPEIVRQYGLRSQKVGVPAGYYLRSAVFIFGSGLVVVAFPGPIPAIDAVYQGVAAPVIVTQGAQHYLKEAKKKNKNRSGEDATPPPDADTIDDLGSHESSDEIYVEVQPHVMVPLNSWRRFFYSL